jgi:hypothetical protein
MDMYVYYHGNVPRLRPVIAGALSLRTAVSMSNTPVAEVA